MSKYESSYDLMSKAWNEGGLEEFVFGYGLTEEDLPDDMPGHIVIAFLRLFDAREPLDQIEKCFDTIPVPEDF